MFVRVLVVLLLISNLGLACWLYFAPRAPSVELPAADPGVPKLMLLSEDDRPIAAGPAMPPAASATPTQARDPKKDVCISVGAFSTQADMRAAMRALSPVVARIQFRELRVTETRGYWVYLPAPGNRERALGVARQLSNKGISDYYVVTAGEQPNAISLGLFHDPANAEKRRSEVHALGFKPEVIQRSDEVPAYWVDYVQADAQPLDWRALVPARSELHAQPIDCF